MKQSTRNPNHRRIKRLDSTDPETAPDFPPGDNTRTSGHLFVPVYADDASAYGMYVHLNRINSTRPLRGAYEPTDQLPYSFTNFTLHSLHTAFRHLGVGDDTVSFDRALKQRTLVGYYERGRTVTYVENWLKGVSEGLIKLHHGRGMRQRIAPAALRWCPTCLEEDDAKRAPKVWKVIHQIPYVFHCPYHVVPLLDRCRRCSTVIDIGNQRRLPADPCRTCGSTSHEGIDVRTSKGYLAMIDLVRSICTEDLWWIRADGWFRHMRGLLNLDAQDSDILQQARRIVLRDWKVESEQQLMNNLRFEGERTMNLSDPNTSLVSATLLERVVLAGALHQLGASPADCHMEAVDSLAKHSPTLQPIVGKLIQGAADLGLSPLIPYTMLESPSLGPISSRFGVTHLRLKKMFSVLSPGEMRVFRASARGRWSLGVDLDPLNEVIRPNDTDEKRREVYRGRVQRAVLRGSIKRVADFEGAAPAAVRWLRRNDNVWLTEFFCSIIGDPKQRLCLKHQRVLASFLAQNPNCSRADIRNAHQQSFVWVQINDAVWFQNNLPDEGTDETIRRNLRMSKHRSQIESFIANQPRCTRFDLWTKCPGAIQWLSKYDRAWLDEMLPAPVRKMTNTRRTARRG